MRFATSSFGIPLRRLFAGATGTCAALTALRFLLLRLLRLS